MMSCGNCFKYAWRLNRQRSTILILIILILAMSRLINVSMTFFALYTDMTKPVELYCTISGEASTVTEEIKMLDGVQYASEYRISDCNLSFNGYTVEVKLMGCESAYMTARFSDDLVTAMDGSMPYIVLDAAVLEAMVNEKGELLAVDKLNGFLMMNFEIGSAKARLCGITEEAEISEAADSDQQFYVYTTLDGYEKLTKSTLAGSKSGRMDDADTTEAAGNHSVVQSSGLAAVNNEKKFMIVLKSGFYLEHILEILDKNGISYTYGESSNQQQTWDSERSVALNSLEISGVMLICALTLLLYQGQLWKLKHKDFCVYMALFSGNKNTFIRINICRFLCLMAISLPCGAAWCWIVMTTRI